MPTRSEIISECGQIQASRLRDFCILQHCDLISKLGLWFISHSCHLSHSSYHSSYPLVNVYIAMEVCWHVCHVDSPHAALHSSMLGKMEATPSTRWRIPCGIRKRIHQKWSMVIEIWLKYWNYINYYWNTIEHTIEILLKYLKDTWNILGMYFDY